MAGDAGQTNGRGASLSLTRLRADMVQVVAWPAGTPLKEAFTETGQETIENLLKEADLLKGDGLYDIENVTVVHHINQALKAHHIFHKDVDYVVKELETVDDPGLALYRSESAAP